VPPDAAIVCLGSIDWAFSWQIPQEVAAAFAERGHRVLYIETTGIRTPGLADTSRLLARLRNWWRARGGIRRAAPRLDLLSPLVLPLPYSSVACWINTRLLLHRIRRWIGPRDGRPIVFLTYVPTPLAHALRLALGPSVLVYYCTDRLSESSPGAARLAAPEREMFTSADVVFTTSHGLQKTASALTPRAVLLTGGVRIDEFDRVRCAEAPPPEPVRGLSRPIAGYVGSLRKQLDLELLLRAARLAPEVTFVLVGPSFVDLSALAACPNVRIVGAVPHEDAVRYMHAFDVGLLPYNLDGFTRDLMPMKLKEYLAAGLPIVSTRLPEVVGFVEEHGPVAAFADDADGFVHAIRAAVAADRPAAEAERFFIARQYDWPRRIELMRAAINAAMEGGALDAGIPLRSAGSLPVY
jgi:glycosyltransferase involved in cell wall biosynthesis